MDDSSTTGAGVSSAMMSVCVCVLANEFICSLGVGCLLVLQDVFFEIRQ